MILEKTCDLILQIYKYRKIPPPRVSNVVIGIGYTGVEIEALCYEPFLGLAQTLSSVVQETSCNKCDFAGKLTEKSIVELMRWSQEAPSLKKIIGIATLNAVSQHILEINNPYSAINGDLVEYLKIDKNTRVIFIGLMKPIVKQVMKITGSITIVEDNPVISTVYRGLRINRDISQLNDEDLPIDVLICSGTTLINNTLEEILSKFKKKAQKIVVIGPTASMIPDILFDYGVDVVGGMKIKNSSAALKVIKEGGGTKLFKQFGKKYNFSKEIDNNKSKD